MRTVLGVISLVIMGMLLVGAFVNNVIMPVPGIVQEFGWVGFGLVCLYLTVDLVKHSDDYFGEN